MNSRTITILAVVLGAAIAAGTAARADDRTFYIDEPLNNSACGGANLGAITTQLADFLRGHGWTGTRYTGSSAWPQDFVEDSFGGLDNLYADSKNLAVFAGHGYTNAYYGWSFGSPHNGKCSVDIDGEVRLGERVSYGGNGRTSYVMSLTCCTGYVPKLATVWFNSRATVGVAQMLGLHGISKFNYDEPRMVVESLLGSSSRTNRGEWLDTMSHCGPWYWFCSNSPVVLSTGMTSAQALSIHNTANLWYSHNDPGIERPNYGYYTYVDNGHGECY